jgi:hypothetical protein
MNAPSSPSPPPPSPPPPWPFRWPVVNPGPSWSVPRVRMPDIFSIQPDFPLDTWFYAGHASDADGNDYSLNLYFARGFDPLDPTGQFVSLGIGVGSAATGDYQMCTAHGSGASDDPAKPLTLTVPPATDTSYSLLYDGGAGGAQGSMAYSGGASMGIKGALYQASASGTSATGLPMALTLDLVDDLGTKMEGMSAYVGPTYEVAQPRLLINGGTLTLGETVVQLIRGSLWHDRQTYTNPPPTGAAAPTALAAKAAPKPLYLGNWVVILFWNGLSADLNTGWPKASVPGTQWIVGRAVDKPPVFGTGNLYFAAGADRYNGGAFLQGVGDSEEDFDYDINIFNPAHPGQSPHWQSPVTGHVYCNKWSVAFSPRLAQWKVPAQVYLAAFVPGCEYAPGDGSGFWEGAVHVFADRDCTNQIGEGFVEQMGYN